MASDRIRVTVRRLSEFVVDPRSQFAADMAKHQVTDPLYSLELTELGLVVYEAKSTTAFSLPRDRASGDLGRMHVELIPDWCLASIHNNSSRQPRLRRLSACDK